MTRQELCDRLERTTYSVEGFTAGEKFSSGSAVAINSRGDLFTAAHVVTNRLPVREEDVNDPELLLIAKTRHGRFIEYKPLIVGFTFHNEHLREPISVDVALLRAVEPRVDVDHLEVNTDPPEVGQEVLMSGFPDEMELPFKIKQVLNYSHPDLRERREEVLKTMKVIERLQMIKSGMIGNKFHFSVRLGDEHVEGDVVYIDNVMHSGARGGPIINFDAQVIGVITQRAVTDASNREIDELDVPSGSTVGVSAQALAPILKPPAA